LKVVVGRQYLLAGLILLSFPALPWLLLQFATAPHYDRGWHSSWMVTWNFENGEVATAEATVNLTLQDHKQRSERVVEENGADIPSAPSRRPANYTSLRSASETGATLPL
jgi:hypothetical protein